MKRHRRFVVAYNRRFYGSTLKAQEIIRLDGGVRSFHFEFTEWPTDVKQANKSSQILEKMVLRQFNHVIDLAFFLVELPHTGCACFWWFGLASSRQHFCG